MNALQVLALILLSFAFNDVTAQSQGLPAAQRSPLMSGLFEAKDVAKLVKLFNDEISSRYMVSHAACVPTPSSDWPGYETLPNGFLKKCRYAVVSCSGLLPPKVQKCMAARRVAGSKKATVVLLEPGFDRMARWILQACREVGGNQDLCHEKVYEKGRAESNWQIPIAGIVFEDMEPAFVHYGYAFRDGVTVKPDLECGWPNGTPEGERNPTAEEEAACSRPLATPLSASTRIRPLSTTRADLLDWDPKLITTLPVGEPTDTGGWRFIGREADSWRGIVREYLVNAATSDRNPLVVAKAFNMRRSGEF